MTIEAKEISYESLVKLYEDKCKYCETLEDRLRDQNKKIDEKELEVNSLRVENHINKKKHVNIKNKYDELYKFAEKLCKIIDIKDDQIKQLIEINEELNIVNDICTKKFHSFEIIYEKIREIL